MKKATPQQVLKIYRIVVAIAAVISLIGALTNSAVIIMIGIGVILLATVLNVCFYKCPHCGKYLDRNPPNGFCPHCGKKIAVIPLNEKDANN